jgi:hypothetical protein
MYIYKKAHPVTTEQTFCFSTAPGTYTKIYHMLSGLSEPQNNCNKFKGIEVIQNVLLGHNIFKPDCQ